MNGLSIGKLARAARVSVHTIRFYERSGLLPQAPRRSSGFREYSELDLRQLEFIRQARSLGFSLEDIAALLAIDGRRTCLQVLEKQLAAVEGRIADLTRWRSALRALISGQSGLIPAARSLLDCLSENTRTTRVTHDKD